MSVGDDTGGIQAGSVAVVWLKPGSDYRSVMQIKPQFTPLLSADGAARQ